MAFALVALSLVVGCAGKPPTPQVQPEGAGSALPGSATPGTQPGAPGPAAGSPNGATQASATASGATASGTGGTSIKTPESGLPVRAQDEKKLIEAALVFGAPESFRTAFNLISTATLMKAEDLRALAWAGAKMGILVYADQATELIPSDLRSATTAIPDSPLARIAAEALSGKVSDPVDAMAGDPVGELLPALAIMRSDSRETARRGLAALDRFERLGVPSLLPDLVRGLDAERRQAWEESLGRYSAVLARSGDVLPAQAGSARCLVALLRPAEALELLAPLGDLPTLRKPRGQALYDAGRLDEADGAVALVLRDDPLDAKFMLMRAHLLIRARAWQQSLPLLDAYGTVDPASRLFLLLRTLASEGLRNRDDALRWVRRGLSAYPEDPELLTAAARLLLQAPASITGGLEAAKQEGRGYASAAMDIVARPDGGKGLTPLQAGLRAQAGQDATRLLLSDAVQRYDWNEASLRLDELKRGPGFEDRATAFLIYRKSGNWAAALELATAWYSERSDLEAAMEAYARALVGTKNESAAQDLIPRLLAGKATAVFRSTLYYLQSLLQKSEEASLSLLRQALVENADNVEALAAFYDYYFRRPDYVKARFYLKQALSLAPSDPDLLRRNRELEASSP